MNKAIKNRIEMVICSVLFVVCAFALLSTVSCTTRDYLVGTAIGKLEKEIGQASAARGNQLYWCREGAHGLKLLMTTKVVEGVVSEAMQFSQPYEGLCDTLIENWIDKRERIK